MSFFKHLMSFAVCFTGFTLIAFVVSSFRDDLFRVGPFLMGLSFYFPVMAVIAFAYKVQR